jgi:hypothetical protein
LRKKKHLCATRIQCKYRQRLAVKRVLNIIALREKNAAMTKIQAIARAYLAKKRIWRIKMGRLHDAEVFRTMGLAAATIARRWRGHAVRSRMWHDIQYIKRKIREMRMSKTERAAMRIQCAYRVYVVSIESIRLAG